MKKKSIMVLCFVIAIFASVLIFLNKGLENEELKNNEIENLNQKEEQEANKDLTQNIEKNELAERAEGIAIPGWAKITIPPNKQKVTVDFYNPEENANLYYLTFELKVFSDSKNDYETLYESDIVKPGEHIKTIELLKGLDVGEYDAIIHVQPYRMDENQTATNNADIKTKIIVK